MPTMRALTKSFPFIAAFSSFQDTLVSADNMLRKHQEEHVPVRAAAPVKVKVLDEALCSGCKEFVQKSLAPAYELLGATVIELQVIPFGNARYVASEDDPNETVLECQHGEAECDANSFEQCVSLHLYPYPQRYLPFIHCLYDELPMAYSDELIDRSIYASCAKKSALDWNAIAACHDDPTRATALQQIAYALTSKDHQYVPWVEIEGAHAEMESDDSFLEAVCAAYIKKGGSHPACAQFSTPRTANEPTEKLSICHAEGEESQL
ncbi:interferon, gamma-inducible protein 30 [Fistulifera solaris]|uniref:Interferon, gamma-inducible protein 30 n=1 Tax=Fistulifera solaris TaxID=1519565 RepID=A0A1Z5KIA3_FISSO|nr:interferon, gamma-inducible protein 30 [Fistulifera solaris]|eukprot:GAX26040.1 interferon, gamma-inducible protein 30 [Fistulifera solaris]